jgi:hypothetical protein
VGLVLVTAESAVLRATASFAASGIRT